MLLSVRSLLFCAFLIAGGHWLCLSDAAAQTPKRGGTVVMVVQPEPTTLVGLLDSAANTYYVSGKVTEGLVTYDWKFTPRPVLATSWSTNSDGTELTFKLRDGVRWHDGKPFTSEDVKFSFEVLKQRHPRGKVTFANIVEILTPDTLTAVLKLSKPAPYLMAALAGAESPMVPKHIYEGTDYATNRNNTSPVGTGPFKFSEWNKGSHLVLIRNDDYWDKGKPFLDRIIARFIPDASARALAFETGEVHLGPGNPIPLSDVNRLSALKHIGVEKRGDEYGALVARMEFNLENQYLKHLKVRQAIAHAVDREFIRKNIWFGFADATAGPISPGLVNFYTAALPQYDFNVAKADKLLDEAGFPRAGNGIRFTLTHDFLPLTDTFQRTAEYLKQALRRVGIEVNIRGQDFPSYIRRVYTERDFDFTNHWMNNTPDPTLGVQRLYWSKSFVKGVPFSNGSGYVNPEMDKLLEMAQVEINPEKRTELWHKVAALVMQDLPDLPLVAVSRVTVFNKKVRDHTMSPVGVADSLSEAWIDE